MKMINIIKATLDSLPSDQEKLYFLEEKYGELLKKMLVRVIDNMQVDSTLIEMDEACRFCYDTIASLKGLKDYRPYEYNFPKS